MLDPDLKARALEILRNPKPSTPERDELMYASMIVESLGLSGIETTIEEILELVRLEKSENMTADNRKRLREYCENDVLESNVENLFETVHRLSGKRNAEDFRRERCQHIAGELRSRILKIENQIKSSKEDTTEDEKELLETTSALEETRKILKARGWDSPVSN